MTLRRARNKQTKRGRQMKDLSVRRIMRGKKISGSNINVKQES